MRKPGRKAGTIFVPAEKRKIGRQVSMSPEEWDYVDYRAAMENTSRSEIIRRALTEYFNRHPDPEQP